MKMKLHRGAEPNFGFSLFVFLYIYTPRQEARRVVTLPKLDKITRPLGTIAWGSFEYMHTFISPSAANALIWLSANSSLPFYIYSVHKKEREQRHIRRLLCESACSLSRIIIWPACTCANYFRFKINPRRSTSLSFVISVYFTKLERVNFI